jgi:hypothetical protein
MLHDVTHCILLALSLPPPPAPQPSLGLGLLFFFEASQQFSFYRVGLLAPRSTSIPEDQASVFISPRSRVATHFSRLLRHAWVTVGLFLFPGHHTGKCILLTFCVRLLIHCEPEMDDWISIPIQRYGLFSLQHRIRTVSGAHATSYPVSTPSSLSGGKAVGAWSWPLTSIQSRG